MKNKLKKDLKFLRTWKGKLLTSLAVALLLILFAGVVMSAFKGRNTSSEAFMVFVTTAIITYVALYFFNAWIVGDEE